MSSDPQKVSYKETLNLPRTDFAMTAKLVENEPKRLAKWQQMDLYHQILNARADAPLWVLHDGPPFANGDIHIGHVINKTLKDVFLRWHSLCGQRTPYIPGWDCHGLPIEHKIQQQLGPKLRQMETVAVRQHCHDYAEKYVNLQSQQFQRLGIMGEWSDPYITMKPPTRRERWRSSRSSCRRVWCTSSSNPSPGPSPIRPPWPMPKLNMRIAMT